MFAIKRPNQETTYWPTETLAVAHAQESEAAVEVFTPFGSLVYSQGARAVEPQVEAVNPTVEDNEEPTDGL